ncbi:MAG: transcription elongation factor GreA [Acidobacteria bacterium]|nr:transcription elongation factor GreA [Acidobacteriota bacterium]MBI3658226.1 transcription elongation factor GreA [Acidobacteriota bacterium]
MEDIRKRLEAEIKELDREIRQVLPKEIKRAREMGDLRENAEYQAARDRQAQAQMRLAHLQKRLAAISMINLERIPHDRASYGSTVVLYDVANAREVTYKLVSGEESDVNAGLISTASPIGKSLMGKEEGDEVKIATPGGLRHYEIKKLTTIHDAIE